MQDFVVGIFAIGVGIAFTFAGYGLMRVLFPLWGLVAGFWFGMELVHAITNDGFFGTTLGVVVGIATALIGALLAYLYYSLAVLFFMGAFGFWLGAGFFSLFGWDLNVASVILGAVLAVVFVAAGFLGNAPKVFLIVITSFAGAALAVTGLLLVFDKVDAKGLEHGAISVALSQGTFWSLVVLVGGIVGLAVQSTVTSAMNTPNDWQGNVPAE